MENHPPPPNRVGVYFIHEGINKMEKCGEGLIDQSKKGDKYVISVQKTQMEDQESDLSEEKQLLLNPNMHQNRNTLLEAEIQPNIQYKESRGKKILTKPSQTKKQQMAKLAILFN